MGLLGGYLRLQIVIVTAVVLAIGAFSILTGTDGILGLLVLFGLIIAGFAALAALFSFR